MNADSVVVRDVRAEDDALLLELYTSTRADEMAMVAWTEEEKAAFVQMQFEAQRTDYAARFPESVHSVIVADGIEVGRIWVDRRPSEIRLLDITILPMHRDRGLGSALLRGLRAEAAERQVPLRHSVYRANTEAFRFYERLGFAVVAEADAYALMEYLPEG